MFYPFTEYNTWQLTTEKTETYVLGRKSSERLVNINVTILMSYISWF